MDIRLRSTIQADLEAVAGAVAEVEAGALLTQKEGAMVATGAEVQVEVVAGA